MLHYRREYYRKSPCNLSIHVNLPLPCSYTGLKNIRSLCQGDDQLLHKLCKVIGVETVGCTRYELYFRKGELFEWDAIVKDVVTLLEEFYFEGQEGSEEVLPYLTFEDNAEEGGGGAIDIMIVDDDDDSHEDEKEEV